MATSNSNQQTTHTFHWGTFLAGVGVGGAIFGGGAYALSRRKLRRTELLLEDSRKARKRAYQCGIDDATAEAQAWIDANVKIVNGTDPDSVRKAIDEAFASDDLSVTTDSNPDAPDILPSPEPQQKTPVPEQLTTTTDVSDSVEAIFEKPESEQTVGDDEIGFRFGDELLKYPRAYFFAEDGTELSPSDVRKNLREYGETNPKHIEVIWKALGFGDFYSEQEKSWLQVDSEGDTDGDANLEDWDLNIEGDEPEVKTKERERYFEEMKRYSDNPNEGPRIVSKREFDEECYLDKVYIDYYALDNVFVDNEDMDNPVDPIALFGVSDGGYLFDNKPMFDEEEDDNDPDIVHVKNFKMNTIAEITRFKKSYASVKDGSVYLDGETDQDG